MNVRLAGFPFRGDVLYEHELPVPVPAPVLTFHFFYSESGVSYIIKCFFVKHTVPGFLFSKIIENTAFAQNSGIIPILLHQSLVPMFT